MPLSERASPSLAFQRTDSDASLRFDVSADPPSDLRLEVSRSRRLRLLAGDRRLMWAQLWEGWYGVTLVRNDDQASPAILPPFRAAEARARQGREAWMRRVAELLVASSRSPLRSGSWRLCALQPASPGASRFVSVRDPYAPEAQLEAHGVYGALEAPLSRDDHFGGSGSWHVWPLRRPSDPDASRVKAWRKHARDGTLPPVVLLSVSALSTYLILDGHDRLAAARAEGRAPDVFVLVPVVEVVRPAQHVEHDVRTYTEYFEAPVVGLAAREALARNLVRAFTPLFEPDVSRAVANPRLDDEWGDEVRAIVGDADLARIASHPLQGTDA